MAKEATEAGDHYNNYSSKFLVDRFNDFPKRKPLSIIEEIKNKFAEWSCDLLENEIKAENIIIKYDEKNNKLEKQYIYESSSNKEEEEKNDFANQKIPEIIPKLCLTDEYGLSKCDPNSYVPSYICYVENETLVVKLELLGHIILEDTYADLDTNKIYIIGMKENDDEIEEQFSDNNINDKNNNIQEKKNYTDPKKILKNTRKYGKFKLIIPFGSTIKLAQEDPINDNNNENDQKEGIRIIKFKLAKRRKNKK
jgi:hypothetical protein